MCFQAAPANKAHQEPKASPAVMAAPATQVAMVSPEDPAVTPSSTRRSAACQSSAHVRPIQDPPAQPAHPAAPVCPETTVAPDRMDVPAAQERPEAQETQDSPAAPDPRDHPDVSRFVCF